MDDDEDQVESTEKRGLIKEKYMSKIRERISQRDQTKKDMEDPTAWGTSTIPSRMNTQHNANQTSHTQSKGSGILAVDADTDPTNVSDIESIARMYHWKSEKDSEQPTEANSRVMTAGMTQSRQYHFPEMFEGDIQDLMKKIEGEERSPNMSRMSNRSRLKQQGEQIISFGNVDRSSGRDTKLSGETKTGADVKLSSSIKKKTDDKSLLCLDESPKKIVSTDRQRILNKIDIQKKINKFKDTVNEIGMEQDFRKCFIDPKKRKLDAMKKSYSLTCPPEIPEILENDINKVRFKIHDKSK